MEENGKDRWAGFLGPRLPGNDATRSAFVPLRLTLIPTGLHVDLTQSDQVIGRHSQADVRIPLADVSRRHCRFVHLGGKWQVIDLDSTNGTFVNEQKVKQAVLQTGDRLRIGSFTFDVQYLTAGAAPVRPSQAGVRLPNAFESQSATLNQRKAG